jgi:tetratricopeptide (TPR) repeat protein
LEFFRKHGVAVDEGNQITLCKLGQIYEGHALVLRVISGEIRVDFRGDVERYWAVNKLEFDQVSGSLESTRLDETECNDELDRRVRDRVKKSLQQLPTDAQDLLFRSSVYRCPVPKKFWLALIDDQTSSQRKEAYRMLYDRALRKREIDQNYDLIRQHNLIRDVAYGLLKDAAAIWETTERKAAQLWLTSYEPAPNMPNLETVRGYLEAFYHYCEVEDWNAASEIYTCQLPSTQQTLDWQLLVWGYYKELISVSCKLVDKITSPTKRFCLNQIGNSYIYLGDSEKSISYFQQALQFTRETHDVRGEDNTLGNLGNAYSNLGQYKRAINYYQNALAISRELGDSQDEGRNLGNLGNAYCRLGQYERAVGIHQEALAISRKIGNRRDEGCDLGSLGIAYFKLGQYEQAVDYHHQYLAIAREIDDRQGEGNALINIGTTQINLNQYPESLINNQAALEIFREIGSRDGEAEALSNFAELYLALSEGHVAQQYCQQAFVLATELGIPLADECKKLQKKIENFISISSG